MLKLNRRAFIRQKKQCKTIVGCFTVRQRFILTNPKPEIRPYYLYYPPYPPFPSWFGKSYKNKSIRIPMDAKGIFKYRYSRNIMFSLNYYSLYAKKRIRSSGA